MPIAFIASAVNHGFNSISIAKPAGTVVNDFMVALVAGSGGPWLVPSGWTAGPTLDEAPNHEARYFWKHAGSSEPSSYLFDATNGTIVGLVATWRGVHQTTPFHLGFTSQDNSSSTNYIAPSLSPTSTGGVLVCMYAVETATSSITPAAGMTQRAIEDDNNEPTSGYTAYCADQTIVSTGATGTKVAVGSHADENYGISGILEPGPPLPVEADGSVSLIGSPTGGIVGDNPYRMRGFDQTLGRVVYWSSPDVDDAGLLYTGPGPLIDVMVFYRCYDS